MHKLLTIINNFCFISYKNFVNLALTLKLICKLIPTFISQNSDQVKFQHLLK